MPRCSGILKCTCASRPWSACCRPCCPCTPWPHPRCRRQSWATHSRPLLLLPPIPAAAPGQPWVAHYLHTNHMLSFRPTNSCVGQDATCAATCCPFSHTTICLGRQVAYAPNTCCPFDRYAMGEDALSRQASMRVTRGDGLRLDIHLRWMLMGLGKQCNCPDLTSHGRLCWPPADCELCIWHQSACRASAEVRQKLQVLPSP